MPYANQDEPSLIVDGAESVTVGGEGAGISMLIMVKAVSGWPDPMFVPVA